MSGKELPMTTAHAKLHDTHSSETLDTTTKCRRKMAEQVQFWNGHLR